MQHAILTFSSWPIVVLVLGLAAIFLFKKEIRRFIDRAQEIKAPGLGIQTGAAQSGPGPATGASPSKAGEELRKMFDNQLVVKRAASISEDLNKRGLPAPEKEEFLLRLASAIAIAWQFEGGYNHIWGSQLELLQHLNTAGPIGMTIEAARPFFDRASQTYPAWYQHYSFDQWRQFLISNNLVLPLQNDRIAITIEGRELLRYLVERGYSVRKLG